MFFELREVPGLKKKPSTSELLDWLKLLLAEDIPPEALRSTDRKVVDPAAARRAAQERAGRAPVRARRRSWRARAASDAAAPPRFVAPVTLRGTHATLEPLARDARGGHRARGRRRRAVAALVHVRAGAGRASASGSRSRSTCATGSARCRSSCATTRAATSSAARATSTSTRRTAGWRSATRGTRGARSAPAINTECKLLLLHARVRVARAASRSSSAPTGSTIASREAIARLGAKQDGVLRNHQLTAGRQPARHRRVQHRRQRMAGGEAPPRVPARPAALTRSRRHHPGACQSDAHPFDGQLSFAPRRHGHRSARTLRGPPRNAAGPHPNRRVPHESTHDRDPTSAPSRPMPPARSSHRSNADACPSGALDVTDGLVSIGQQAWMNGLATSALH